MKHLRWTTALALMGIAVIMVTGTLVRKVTKPTAPWGPSTPISTVLTAWTGSGYPHQLPEMTDAMVKQGKDIVFTGRTIGPDGKPTKIQSIHYVCTDCHNQKREDPDLTHLNPDTRLDYVIKNNMPFLQGTTFWGVVNRESWYNDDYVKKYGDAVKPASQNIREAIQLCSIGCSAGRYLEQWELDAVLAYFFSLEVTLGDLSLTDTDWSKIKDAQDGQQHPELMAWLKQKYTLKSPATFLEMPADLKSGYGPVGNPENGQKLFQHGCMSCHNPEGPSKYLTLNESNLTKDLFRSHMFRQNSNYNLYRIVRIGTHSMPGHKAYMPHYTLERMSLQQLEDLRAFIGTK